MALQDLFASLRLKQREEAQSAEQEYESTVIALADGKELKPDKVHPILANAGRDVEQLQQDVELLLQRRAWRNQLDAEPKLLAKREKLAQQIEAEKSAFMNLRSEHELALASLGDQHAAVERDLYALDGVRIKLAETANVTRWQSDIGTQRVRPLSKKIEALKLQLRQEEAAARQARNEYSGEEIASGYEAKANRLRGEIAELEREMADAQSEIKELQEQALTVA